MDLHFCLNTQIGFFKMYSFEFNKHLGATISI